MKAKHLRVLAGMLLLLGSIVFNRVGMLVVEPPRAPLQTVELFQHGSAPFVAGLVGRPFRQPPVDIRLSVVYGAVMRTNETKAIVLQYDRYFDLVFLESESRVSDSTYAEFLEELEERHQRITEETEEAINTLLDMTNGSRSTPWNQTEETMPTMQRLEVQRHRPPSEKPLSASLRSAGFEIDKEEIGKSIGTPIPTEFFWTISPKRPGEHMILLDITGVIVTSATTPSNYRYDNGLSINGERRVLPQGFVLQLPVTVTTIWGVSEVTENIIWYLIVLTGLILGYPIVIDWFRKFLGKATDPQTDAGSE